MSKVDMVIRSFVSGVEFYADGPSTGELFGRLVRGAVAG